MIQRREWILRHFSIGFLFVLGLLSVSAEPSGGPYGPVGQTYQLPKGAGKIYYVAVDGQAELSGETPAKPTTLEAAVERVCTGDVIVMRGGVYRTGNLMLNQGITIQPYANERPILKGTFVADQWKNLGNGLWTTPWKRLFPSKPLDWWQRDREGKKTPLHRFNNDMVFVDGRFLQSAGWEGEVSENTFYIDYDAGLVYIGVDPTNRLVEITAFDVALLRTTRECHGKPSDRKGYTVRGVTFTQYAFRALEVEGTEPEGVSEESKHGKDVIGTTLEDCTISYCSRVAAYLRGDSLTIRRCRVSDTSTEGIYIIASNDVLLEKNILMRNNIEGITGYYPAAVKIFNQCHRVTCRDNLVTDLPNSNGIWYDVGNVDGLFLDNRVENVGHIEGDIRTNQLWPSDNGFFFEISKGAVCAGNVFVNCDHGIMVLNSSNVRICRNTLVNSMLCIGRNARHPAGDLFGWHSSTGPDVDKREGHVLIDNLMTGDERFTRPLLFVWQPASLCQQLPQSQLKQCDYNMFVRGRAKTNYPLILWSPASNDTCQVGFESIEEFRKSYPEFLANGRFYQNYDGPLFKCRELGDFRLLKSFPDSKMGIPLPADIGKFFAGMEKERFVGAYAPVP
jgi:hypothetical protein